MSKKYLALIIVPVLLMFLAVMALPGDAMATQLLGITITPTPIVTEPPTPTPTDIVTEEPQPPTETPVPPEVTQPPPPATAKPKTTEVVLLPETGEFPIDPAQGIQWLFALTMIFLIGGIILRTLRTAKIKK